MLRKITEPRTECIRRETISVKEAENVSNFRIFDLIFKF